MKLFECQSCGHTLYFENTSCERCHHRVGYLPGREQLSAVEPEGQNWRALADPKRKYRFCANWERQACNWMVEAGASNPYCSACQHNRTIPNLSDHTHEVLWRRMEEAKHRLVYSLIKLRLPAPSPSSGDRQPLVFDFLAEAPQHHARIMTGHEDGVITISLSEADDAARERLRAKLHEPYRTLLGHFRHEVGHYYWDRLVRDGGKLQEFRQHFGDETLDYDNALQAHYQNGPPANWQQNYVSAYATMHPWEDFAETWAHYLHIVDTLEMAHAFNLRIAPRLSSAQGLTATAGRDPYSIESMDELLNEWLPVTFAVNSLNRSMGQPDLYPFVLSVPAMAKLSFVHRLVRGAALARPQTASMPKEREPTSTRKSLRRWFGIGGANQQSTQAKG